MKLLFQGGWRAGRDPENTREIISAYCLSLAEHVVDHNHQLILTSNREYDQIIANHISKMAKNKNKSVKDHLLFLLADRIKELPVEGRVKRFPSARWWIEERTYCVEISDVLIAVGGGKGTFDCVEKAFLSRKPVFVAATIPCRATDAWKRRSPSYRYLSDGDADFAEDLNITPNEFFGEVFKIIGSLANIVHSRRVFVVHGRDHHFKDGLVYLLRSLDFDPIVLQDEPSKSLTVMEKLERDTESIGFGFVLYTSDDISHLPNQPERYRARQNVVFEHGLLIGLLGRERTCALIKGDVEIPSDIQGVLHEHVDDVKQESLKIARVLRDAGYSIDGSKLL